MKSMDIRPGMSPLVSHEINVILLNATRFTLSWSGGMGGSSQVVYGEILRDVEPDPIMVRVINGGSPMYLNRRFIVADQDGYTVYKQVIHHKNPHFKDENPRIRYGARRIDQGELVASDGSGKDFEKETDKIYDFVKVG